MASVLERNRPALNPAEPTTEMQSMETQPPTNGPTGRASLEAHVVLRLEASDPCSEEELEQAAGQALEAVEQRVANVALGPVVSWNIQTCVIEIDFTVEANANAEVHEKIALVVAVIEESLPIVREQAAETSAELVYA